MDHYTNYMKPDLDFSWYTSQNP